jgi:hypothetical protein
VRKRTNNQLGTAAEIDAVVDRSANIFGTDAGATVLPLVTVQFASTDNRFVSPGFARSPLRMGKILVHAKKRLIYQFCGTFMPFV